MKPTCGDPNHIQDTCEMCVRADLANALRKRAEYLSPYDNDRGELLRAADLIEKGELP